LIDPFIHIAFLIGNSHFIFLSMIRLIIKKSSPDLRIMFSSLILQHRFFKYLDSGFHLTKH
jgi:hypothetical protein